MLAEKPDDTAANLVVGKYYWFAQGEWAKGTPLVLKGDDEALKKMAAAEQAAPTAALERVALADQWWDVGAGKGMNQRAARQRAAYWYQKAMPDLSGFTKTRVEHRLDELEQQGITPPKEKEEAAKE